MLNKTHGLAFILLLSFSLQYHDNGPSPGPAGAVNATKGPDRAALIGFAKQYLGTPYRSNSINPKNGFDCSGFVYFVFKKFHLNVPRSSRGYQSVGKALKPEEFKVGDILVFYGYRDRTRIGHVGIICIANGTKSRFIHSSSGKPHGVTISELDSKGYRHRFYKCIDVIE
jgi:cell wall-associated NlpC family hydrolase